MEVNGSVRIESSTEEAYIVNGSAVIEFKDKCPINLSHITINDSAIIKNVIIQRLTVNGDVKIENCTVEGESTIAGHARVERSVFKADLYVTMWQFSPKDCLFEKNIICAKIPFFSLIKKTKVVLNAGSIVKGKVIFAE